MMESSYIPSMTPMQESWCIEGEQDFCFGAKTSSQLSPGSATPSSLLSSPNYDSPNWLEESKNFDWNNFETFSDVILPGENFGPDDLFQGITEEAPSTFNSHMDVSSIEPEPAPIKPLLDCRPKITIRLKKVKKPPETKIQKEKLLSPILFPIKKDELLPSQSPTFMYVNSPDIFFEKDEQNLSSLSTESSSTIKQDFEVFDCSDEFMQNLLPDSGTSPNRLSDFNGIPLKDLVDMGDANCVLDEFLDASSSTTDADIQLSPISSTSQQESEFTSSIDISSDLENFSIKKKTPKKQTKQTISRESRYNRKKEQNKQAALRYRMKKRQEDNHLLEILQGEEQKNAELKETYSNLKKELQFMKKMMREAFIAKGLVSAKAFKSKK